MSNATVLLGLTSFLQENSAAAGGGLATVSWKVLVLLGIVMIASGLSGGYGGYLLGPPDPGELEKEKRSWYRRRSLTLGVVASFMVPLFLSVVGAASGADKNLVDQLAGSDATIGAWLVLIGFCLVAAVSSQRFISALTKKLIEDALKEARSATKSAQAATARAEAASVTAKEAVEETEELEDDVAQLQVAVRRTQPEPISAKAREVLRAAYMVTERRPSLEDIKGQADIDEDAVRDALGELESRGLIKSKQYDGVKRWRVRTAGKAVIAMEQSGTPAPAPKAQ